MMMIMFHKPVMLKEAIDSLEIKGSGVYVDLTFGGGGHSKEILQRINDDGRLIAFDQDESAIKNKIDDSRVVLLKQNFIYLEQNLKYLKISKVDGACTNNIYHYSEKSIKLIKETLKKKGIYVRTE